MAAATMPSYVAPQSAAPKPPMAAQPKSTGSHVGARRKLLAVARKATIEAADAEEDAEAALCAAKTQEERDAALEMLREAAEMAAEADSLMKQAESKMRRRQERASPPGLSPSPPLSDASARSADTTGSILSTDSCSGRRTPHSGRLHSLTGSTPRRGVSVPLQPINVNSTYGSNVSLRSAANGNVSARSTNCNISTGSNRSVGPIKVRPARAGAVKDKANESTHFEVQGRALGSHPEEPVGRVPTPPVSKPPAEAPSRQPVAQPPHAETTDGDGHEDKSLHESGCAWECSLCTKSNVGTAQACGVCGRKRGHLASARPTRRAIRHDAAVRLQSAYRGRAARATVTSMRPGSESTGVDTSSGAVAYKQADLTKSQMSHIVGSEDWQDGEEAAAAGKFDNSSAKDQTDKVILECDESVSNDEKGASWSNPDAAADFEELNAIMERLQQQIPDSEDTPLPRESPKQEAQAYSNESVGREDGASGADAQQQQEQDLNVSIADATRMTEAFHKEAERLASAAKEAQERAMNESVAWEDAHERSTAAFENAKRLSIELREEEEKAAKNEAEARRLSSVAREEAVSRSRAEAAAARAAKKEAMLEKARKAAAAAAKREHELEERKKKMESEQKQAAEAAETARKRASAAADREQALRKQQDERVKNLRQDEQDKNKIAAEKQKLIAQLDRKLQSKLVGCSGPKRFMQVLRVFGVALDSNESAAVQKAYRKAMVLFHPDRAQRKGESWQKIVEAEEIYKLIQNEYQQHEKVSSSTQYARPPPAARPPPNNYWQQSQPQQPKYETKYQAQPPRSYAQPQQPPKSSQYNSNQYSARHRQHTQPQQSCQTWKCRVCTKVNNKGDDRCKVCGRPEGAANTGDTARHEAQAAAARRQYENLQRQARQDAERIRAEQAKRREDAATATATARAKHAQSSAQPAPNHRAGAAAGEDKNGSAGWRRFFRW